MKDDQLSEPRKPISAFLKARREELGYSVQEFATLCGVQKTTIYRIEAGKFMPNMELAIKMGEHLKADLKFIPREGL